MNELNMIILILMKTIYLIDFSPVTLENWQQDS